MKNLNKIFFIIIFFLNSSMLNANEKYVYVDLDFLINSSEAGKYISSTIENIHKKKIKDLKII